jgi:hypothetical protein
MKYTKQVWKQSNPPLWGWSIFDEYGDEVASQQKMFEDEDECRKEASLALSDWQE